MIRTERVRKLAAMTGLTQASVRSLTLSKARTRLQGVDVPIHGLLFAGEGLLRTEGIGRRRQESLLELLLEPVVAWVEGRLTAVASLLRAARRALLAVAEALGRITSVLRSAAGACELLAEFLESVASSFRRLVMGTARTVVSYLSRLWQSLRTGAWHYLPV